MEEDECCSHIFWDNELRFMFDMPWSAHCALQGFLVTSASLERELFKAKIAFIWSRFG